MNELTDAERQEVLEWATLRPILLAKWQAEAMEMYPTYGNQKYVRNYMRQQEALYWHRKRQGAK